MKKVLLTFIAALFATNTLNAVLPNLPSTTNVTTLKKLFKKTKNSITPKLQKLKELIEKYNKQALFAEEFEHIKLYVTFQDEKTISEDDRVKKYQIAIAMLNWYIVQMSGWLQDLEHEGEDFHLMYF